MTTELKAAAIVRLLNLIDKNEAAIVALELTAEDIIINIPTTKPLALSKEAIDARWAMFPAKLSGSKNDYSVKQRGEFEALHTEMGKLYDTIVLVLKGVYSPSTAVRCREKVNGFAKQVENMKSITYPENFDGYATLEKDVANLQSIVGRLLYSMEEIKKTDISEEAYVGTHNDEIIDWKHENIFCDMGLGEELDLIYTRCHWYTKDEEAAVYLKKALEKEDLTPAEFASLLNKEAEFEIKVGRRDNDDTVIKAILTAIREEEE